MIYLNCLFSVLGLVYSYCTGVHYSHFVDIVIALGLDSNVRNCMANVGFEFIQQDDAAHE
jgi:hypothetical protein